MSKNRIKNKLTEPTLTRDDVEALVHDIASIKNNERKIVANMDSHLAAVRKEFEGPLNLIGEALKIKTAAVQQWAETHPEEFGKRKSIDFTSGTIGFRTGTPKLALLNRKWNWASVLQTLKTAIGWDRFIRTVEEVDRETIIAASRDIGDTGQPYLSAEQLAKVGLKVVQEESFYVEPDLTPLETREVTPSARLETHTKAA